MATAAAVDGDNKDENDYLSAFTCAVCLDLFSTPKLLPSCGHSVCLRCLKKVLSQQQDNNNNVPPSKIICPECRAGTKLGPKGLDGLKTNIQIQRVVDYLNHCSDYPTGASHDEPCPHLPLVKTPYHCRHCQHKFCRPCLFHHMEVVRIEMAWIVCGFEERIDNISPHHHCHHRVPFNEIEVTNVTKDDKDKQSDKLTPVTELEKAGCDVATMRDQVLQLRQIPLIYCVVDEMLNLYDKLVDKDTQILELERPNVDKTNKTALPSDFQLLHRAAKNGDVASLKVMFSRKNFPETWRRLIADHQDVETAEHMTPLLDAASNSHVDAVQFLVQDCYASTNVKSFDHRQSTVIHLAAANGHVAVVRWLLTSCNPDMVDWRDRYQETPLCRAASQGHFEVVKFLVLEAGANVSLKNARGFGALNLAAERGHLEIVRFLVENSGCDLSIDESTASTDGGDAGTLAIHCAVENGHLDLVRYLLEEVDSDLIDEPNYSGDTPFFIAIMRGHVEIVQFLLNEYGVGELLEQRSDFGRTPLHEAVAYQHLDLVRYLVEQGADVTAKAGDNDEHRTVLHLAIGGENGEAIIEYLLANEAITPILEAKAANGKTPLGEALSFCTGGDEEKGRRYVDMLRKRGARQ